MNKEIKYHYLVIGVDRWFAWGRDDRLLKALDICRKELSMKPGLTGLIKEQRFTAYKFPEDYEAQIDHYTVRFLPGDDGTPVDMALVTKIDL